MKKALFILLALPFISSRCNESRNNFIGRCLSGKVIRITCATTVVQVLSTDKVGDDNWTDSMTTKQTYNNVFSVSNKCEMPGDWKPGQEFTFTLDTAQATQCISCMMYDAPPKALFHIKNVSSNPCPKDQ